MPQDPDIDWDVEMEKCRASPYYYMTKYWIVDGKPFTTPLTEEEFNKQIKEAQNGNTYRIRTRRI